MKRFELFEHTADIGLRAYGRNLEEVFVNTALGMFSLLTGTRIKEKEVVGISIQGYDIKELLVNFLSELLYLYNIRGLLINRVEVNQISQTAIQATAFGETYLPEKHELVHEIKTVTYHQLKVEEKNGCWQSQVIFDV